MKENIKQLGDWVNYFPGSFIVISELSPFEIYQKLQTNISGDRILILEVNLNNYYGILPKDAWDWFSTKRKEIGI